MEQPIPAIITADQARLYDIPFGQARILVDGDNSSGAWWMGLFRMDAGFATPLHFHHKTDEYLYVLEGVLSVYINGGWHDLRAGTLAVVPHGVPHAQRNGGEQSVRILGAGDPAGFERVFAAQHKLLAQVPPSDARFLEEIAKALGEHDTQIIGAPPP